MQTANLNAELRTETGKNANNRLRMRGYIPGVVYSHGTTEQVQVKQKDFFMLFKGHISESVLFDLNIAGKASDNLHKVFIKDFQLDPVTDDVLHLDFFKIRADEKIHTKVHLEFIGKAEGEKLGGIMDIFEREVELECLPAHLPEKITIDVTSLKLNDSIHVRDLNLGSEIKLLSDPDRVIVSVALKREKEVEETTEESAAAEATPKKAADSE